MGLDRLQGLGTARLTVSTTAVAFATTPNGAVTALIRCKSAAVCFTDDGVTTPTSTVGQELEAGDTLSLLTAPSQFKAIRRDGADATLVVTYYGPGN